MMRALCIKFAGLLSLATATALLPIGCSSDDGAQTPGTSLDHGTALFVSHAASPSTVNGFACATCHRTSATDRPNVMLAGRSLAGVVDRATYWGGQEPDLLTAINDCRFYFMRARDPWTADDEDARALYGYLASLPADSIPPLAPNWVTAISNLPTGDAVRGAVAYKLACASCHGAIGTGADRLAQPIAPPVLPSETIAAHEYLGSDLATRAIFIEKTRHGGFFGYGGEMPLFTREVLSDADLAAILAYMRVPDPK